MPQKKDVQALLIIGVFYLLLQCAGITCPIKFVTGVSCPGCGMSRAWFSLLRLDFFAAYAYHPLFWLPVPALAVFLLRARLPRRVYLAVMAGMGAAFLLVYGARMLDTTDSIVVFAPGEGALWRLLTWFWQRRM